MSAAVFPAATLCLSALTYKLVWYDEHNTMSLRTLVDACLRNSMGWFNKDQISSSFGPQLNDIMCIRLAFLKQLFSDRAGNGAFIVYGSILFPLVLRLSYKAASPNSQSIFQGLILPALAIPLASSSVLLLGTGLGIFIPPVVAFIYLLGASNGKTSTLSVPLPAATRAVYGANLSVILTCFLFVFQFFHGDRSSVKEPAWWQDYVHKDVTPFLQILGGIFADLFPLVVSIPLIALGLSGVEKPRNEERAVRHLKDNYLASEVAYGFERTWAYYRQAGLLSAFAYCYGMSRIIKGVFVDRAPLTSATTYLLLVSLSLALAQLSLIVADEQLTPKDAVDEEARRAITKAPAGNPGVDDDAKVLAALALVTGPSLPAMLWYAKGEELRGWKGRRAWRLATAEKKASK